MSTLEERVARIEGQMTEQSRGIACFQGEFRRLHQRIDGLEQRVGRLEQRVARLEERVATLEQCVARLEHRIESLRDKMSRQFVWTVGLQFTTLVTIIGVVLARG